MKILHLRVVAAEETLSQKLHDLINRVGPSFLPQHEHVQWFADSQEIVKAHSLAEAEAIIHDKCDDLAYLDFFHRHDCPPSLDNIVRAKQLDPDCNR